MNAIKPFLHSLMPLVHVAAVFFGTLYAVFRWADTAEDGRHDSAKGFFLGFSRIVENSKTLRLHEDLIKWFIKTKYIMSTYSNDLRLKLEGNETYAISIFVGLAFFSLFQLVADLYFYNHYILLLIYIFIIFMAFAVLGFLIYRMLKLNVRTDKEVIKRFVAVFTSLLFMVAAIEFIESWIKISTMSSIWLSIFLLVSLTPLAWFAFQYILFAIILLFKIEKILNRKLLQTCSFFSLSLSLSFIITLSGLLIGHLLEPSAMMPLAKGMLLSNVLFDSLTIVATYAILEYAVKDDTFYRIPLAVLFDLLVAAIFAVCSLYFGTHFSPTPLTIEQVQNVLLFQSIDGARFETGPYFWVMHTTFLPTLFYLSIIFIGWFARAFTIPVRKFFSKAGSHSSPLKYTSETCFAIAGILGLLSLL